MNENFITTNQRITTPSIKLELKPSGYKGKSHNKNLSKQSTQKRKTTSGYTTQRKQLQKEPHTSSTPGPENPTQQESKLQKTSLSRNQNSTKLPAETKTTKNSKRVSPENSSIPTAHLEQKIKNRPAW
jgi:hypothetical protein